VGTFLVEEGTILLHIPYLNGIIPQRTFYSEKVVAPITILKISFSLHVAECQFFSLKCS